jgi:hypothetical protein
MPAELRQVVVEATKVSAGHAADVPEQFSAESQMPAELRQVVVEATKLSPGQAADVPVQFSAESQMPAELRQAVVDTTKESPGQEPLAPVHFSAVSQIPAEARQVTVLAVKVQVPEQQLLAAPLLTPLSQDSPLSVTPLPHTPLTVSVTLALVWLLFPASWPETVNV